MSSPRLTSLVIHKYRHVVPGTRLEFGAGFNVLLGRNGTGKTTLLELIEMIWSKGFEPIADHAFHLEYTVQFDDAGSVAPIPGCKIQVDVANAVAEAIRPDTKHSRSPSSELHFRYRVTVTNLLDDPALVVEGTPMGAAVRYNGRSAAVPVLTTSSWPVVWDGPRHYFGLTPDADLGTPPEHRVMDWAEWCSVILDDLNDTGRYDESLVAFQALTSNEYRTYDSGLKRAQWEVARGIGQNPRPHSIKGHKHAYFPVQVLESWWQKLAKEPRLEPPEFQDSLRDLGLATFLELTGYDDVVVRSGTPTRERSNDTEYLKFGAPEFRILLPKNRGEIPAQALSYGEKRLLAFLWHLACDPSIIIADELVNGFHHEWIERCVELMTGRQAFLASQNPLLLDCLPLESEDDVRRSFITCRRDPDGQMSWQNLSVEEAAKFYASYQKQIRHTNEILRGQELW